MVEGVALLPPWCKPGWVAVFNRSRMPSCLWATRAPFFTRKGMANWETISTSTLTWLVRQWHVVAHSYRVPKFLFVQSKALLFERIALSQELVPLSLACFIKRSRSGGRDASIWSILNLVVSVLSDCQLLFRFSTDCALVTMNALWVLINSTRCLEIGFDAMYWCGTSTLRFGIPIPPCAGVKGV